MICHFQTLESLYYLHTYLLSYRHWCLNRCMCNKICFIRQQWHNFLNQRTAVIPISHRTTTIILAGIQSSCSTPTMVQWILLHWSPRKKVQFLTEKRAHHFAVKRVNTERIVRSWAFRLPRQRFDVARQRRVFVQLMHMILHIMTNSYTPDNIEWNVHYITMICLALVASK